MKKILLCHPGRACCPEVTVYKNGCADIKDEGQTVRFTPQQWDTLKQKIKDGEL